MVRADQGGDKHILQHRTLRQQIVVLKDKTDVAVAKIGQVTLYVYAQPTEQYFLAIPFFFVSKSPSEGTGTVEAE